MDSYLGDVTARELMKQKERLARLLAKPRIIAPEPFKRPIVEVPKPQEATGLFPHRHREIAVFRRLTPALLNVLRSLFRRICFPTFDLVRCDLCAGGTMGAAARGSAIAHDLGLGPKKIGLDRDHPADRPQQRGNARSTSSRSTAVCAS
jgi:hypothetical protein